MIAFAEFYFFDRMQVSIYFNGVSYVFFFLSASGEKKKSTYFSPGEAGPVEEFLESEQ